MTDTIVFICDMATAVRLRMYISHSVSDHHDISNHFMDAHSIQDHLHDELFPYRRPTQCPALSIRRDHLKLRKLLEMSTLEAFHACFLEAAHEAYVILYDFSYDYSILFQRRDVTSYPLWEMLNSMYDDTRFGMYYGFIGFLAISRSVFDTTSRAINQNVHINITCMDYDSLPFDVSSTCFLKSERFHGLRVPIGSAYIFFAKRSQCD